MLTSGLLSSMLLLKLNTETKSSSWKWNIKKIYLKSGWLTLVVMDNHFKYCNQCKKVKYCCVFYQRHKKCRYKNVGNVAFHPWGSSEQRPGVKQWSNVKVQVQTKFTWDSSGCHSSTRWHCREGQRSGTVQKPLTSSWLCADLTVGNSPSTCAFTLPLYKPVRGERREGVIKSAHTLNGQHCQVVAGEGMDLWGIAWLGCKLDEVGLLPSCSLPLCGLPGCFGACTGQGWWRGQGGLRQGSIGL